MMSVLTEVLLMVLAVGIACAEMQQNEQGVCASMETDSMESRLADAERQVLENSQKLSDLEHKIYDQQQQIKKIEILTKQSSPRSISDNSPEMSLGDYYEVQKGKDSGG